MKKHILQDCVDFAISKGGKCLSIEYAHSRKKMLWSCINDHKWLAMFNDIKNNGTWCPECAGVKKHTLQDCINFAINKGGKCLSIEYINAQTKMLWMCKYNHRWEINFAHICNGTWCPECSRTKKCTLQDCINFAINKGGKCLSTEYINARTDIIWQCNKNHIWSAIFDSIKNHGSWCPHCNNNAYFSINECIEIAKVKNGKCLSMEYVNAKTHLIWQCDKNHIWNAILDSIRRGSWCPYCIGTISKVQKEIYEYLINMYPNLNIILNDTQIIKPLELDIYIPSLKLGIEYDGEYWHYSDWAVKNGALERMIKKEQICIEKDIKLLRIKECDWLKNKEVVLQKTINSIESNLR